MWIRTCILTYLQGCHAVSRILVVCFDKFHLRKLLNFWYLYIMFCYIVSSVHVNLQHSLPNQSSLLPFCTIHGLRLIYNLHNIIFLTFTQPVFQLVMLSMFFKKMYFERIKITQFIVIFIIIALSSFLNKPCILWMTKANTF